MGSVAEKRIMRELKVVQNAADLKELGINIRPLKENVMELKGELKGPPETPYEGGKFVVVIKIPSDYPFQPPKARFVTRVWHPNVSSQTGAICLNILNSDVWSPTLNLRTLLISIQVLLGSPEAEDPQDAVVGGQCREEPGAFADTARTWAREFAAAPGEPHPGHEEAVRAFLARRPALPRPDALAALSWHRWDLHKALAANPP